jgi:hypothetical protein
MKAIILARESDKNQDSNDAQLFRMGELQMKCMTAFCGSGEIRTHDALSDMTVFKTVPFNRSGTLPRFCKLVVFYCT